MFTVNNRTRFIHTHVVVVVVVTRRVLVCTDDWLEIYNIYKDGTEKIVGRYCGMTAPGPLESNRGAIGLKILLHTNSEGVSSGFKARYFFDVAKPIFGGECWWG